MATKPSRLQRQAFDQLVDALVLIAGASRLDGRNVLDRRGLESIAERLAGISSAFSLEEILARGLERRALALGFPPSTAELLTLIASDVTPTAMLLLTDEELKALIEQAEKQLEEV